jgi:hypothetical protein
METLLYLVHTTKEALRVPAVDVLGEAFSPCS